MTDDPFALFGVERRFSLDLQVLRQRFLQASAQQHPDRFTDPIQQADAVETMSRLTDAYRTLTDAESRARAMLELSGFESQGDKDKLPADLLMQVMEVREEMESAINSGATDELNRLRTWANEQRANYLEKLGSLLDEELDADKAAQARLELNALRYMQRMLEQMPDQ